MHDYKKLNVWIDSKELVSIVYRITANYPKEEQFGIINQIRRSSVSIPSNISEGAGRGFDKEFVKFLKFAYGSSCELDTQLIISNDLDYLSDVDLEDLSGRLVSIQKKLFNLIKSLQSNEKRVLVQ